MGRDMRREQIDRLAMLIDPRTLIEPTQEDRRLAAEMLGRLHRENESLRDKCAAMDDGLKSLSQRLDEQKPGICESHGPYLRACPECVVGKREAELLNSLAAEERAHGSTIDERDEAESALSKIHLLATGESPRWSNNYGYAEAVERIESAIAGRRLLENACLREALGGMDRASAAYRIAIKSFGVGHEVTNRAANSLQGASLVARKALAGGEGG